MKTLYTNAPCINTMEAEPNKPMVPTAPTSLIEYAPSSLRRHIGQPFGSFDDVRSASSLGTAQSAERPRAKVGGARA